MREWTKLIFQFRLIKILGYIVKKLIKRSDVDFSSLFLEAVNNLLFVYIFLQNFVIYCFKNFQCTSCDEASGRSLQFLDFKEI